MTHQEFIFNAQVLGFNIETLFIDENTLCISGEDVKMYLFNYNPVLPDNIIINIDWDSIFYDIDLNKYKQVLPDNLTVIGSLTLYQHNLKNNTLPKNLHCTDGFYLEDLIINEFSDNISTGYVNFSGCTVKSLPDDFIIDVADLYLDSKTKLITNSTITVLGNLHKDDEFELPKNIIVRGKIINDYEFNL